jgi:hypothetical protein
VVLVLLGKVSRVVMVSVLVDTPVLVVVALVLLLRTLSTLQLLVLVELVNRAT